MENTENQQVEVKKNSELKLTNESLENLNQTRKWTMFFAILGFVGIGFLAIGFIIMAIIGSVGGIMGHMESAIFGVLAVLYLIIGVLYFFPVMYLLKFSTNMKTAIEQTKQNNLVYAFEYLKSHYKFMGIFTIAIFGLYIVAGIIIGIIAVASAF